MSAIPERTWGRILAFNARIREALGQGGGAPLEQETRDLKSWIDGLEENSLARCYGTLLAARARGSYVIGQIGQSLDGRIATESGHSHYINGPECLDHLHRLRALADAVVVGASTADLDDPRLTTRRVEGPNPVRVVIDARARVDNACSVFHDGLAPTILIHGPQDRPLGETPVIQIGHDTDDGVIAPADILTSLHHLGLTFVLIEGGTRTLSRFIATGSLHRLHVMVAPLLLGSGRPGLKLPVIKTVDAGFRPKTRTHHLGTDVLFDCDLAAGQEDPDDQPRP